MYRNINMHVRLCILLLLGFESVFSAEKGAACVTPNKENATCKPLIMCEEIYSAVATGGIDAIQFAKESLCGYDGKDPMVCCGSTGFPSATTVSKDGEVLLRDFDLGTSLLPDRSLCGLVEKRYKISGGKFSEFAEFPWSAALEYTSQETNKVAIKCGGTLINKKFVLTAAHCLSYPKYKLTAVLLGEWKLSTDPDCLDKKTDKKDCAPPVRRFKIKKENPHFFYNSIKMSDDIALVKLENDLVYDGFARPICLPPLNLLPAPHGTLMTIAGWGARENGALIDTKTNYEIPVLGDCQKSLDGLNITVSKNQQCLGGESGNDLCLGDSGGGVMKMYKDVVFKEAQWYLEGVVSWDKECANPEYPIIFHRVSKYIHWIVYTITEDEIRIDNNTNVDV